MQEYINYKLDIVDVPVIVVVIILLAHKISGRIFKERSNIKLYIAWALV